ncbi:E3 ubiquitin/ISG15 ligase TRIM25-like isoform X2 [Channa argus]|uniref:E3 ubiquitin/ISG15 ligase TRIM25-like isoform X2 n=1 Tax=Channa argus TaxID=215402 RepID=UPI00351FF4FC
MAEVDDALFSLMSLEDELTCSICLSTFDCPVTTPCGHNFCQDCLLATWKDSYSCPQCRTHFPTKPDLKKNTVLSTVVETFTLRSNKIESSLSREEDKVEKKDVIRCDACMEAVASQTCLTCMASYCEEHLRPHRENPNFSVHQLTEPVGDLFERICPDHHKVMDLFCGQHGRLICSLCLQQVHKGCSFMSPEEQRNLKESEFRDKVALLVGKIEKTERAMLHMNDTQTKLKDEASKRKAAVAAVYQQMRNMLAQDERDAQITVDRELEIGQTKLRELVKRLTDNTETMTKARENINGVLSQSQTLGFLQASFELPKVAKFEPHVPRINLDTSKVAATQAFARELKEQLTDICKQPVEARLPIVKPGEKPVPLSEPASPKSTGSQQESVQQLPPEQKRQPRPYCPSGPPIPSYFQPIPVPFFPCMGSQAGWNPSRFAQGPPPGYHMAPPFMARQRMDKKSYTSHKTPLAKKSDTSHQSPHRMVLCRPRQKTTQCSKW